VRLSAPETRFATHSARPLLRPFPRLCFSNEKRSIGGSSCTRQPSQDGPGISAPRTRHSKPCFQQIAKDARGWLGSPYSARASIPIPFPTHEPIPILRSVICHCSSTQFRSEGRNAERFAEGGRDVISAAGPIRILRTHLPSRWAG